jgi:hypothetical protein
MAVNKTEAEEQKIEQRVAPSAHVIHDVVLRQGEDELERPASALAWSGLAAGMSMGFSLIAEGLLHAMLPNSEWRPLITEFKSFCGVRPSCTSTLARPMSPSNSKTLRPERAASDASVTASHVLPTPPLPEAMATRLLLCFASFIGLVR